MADLHRNRLFQAGFAGALAVIIVAEQSQLITLEDEARWAMARGYIAMGPVPNFLPHLYLDALLAVQPERVTVLR
jgi:NitT/TauT family transport system substrate-binding protein